MNSSLRNSPLRSSMTPPAYFARSNYQAPDSRSDNSTSPFHAFASRFHNDSPAQDNDNEDQGADPSPTAHIYGGGPNGMNGQDQGAAANGNGMDAAPVDPNKIELKVQKSDGQYVKFKIKRTMALGKLFNAYAQKNGQDLKTLRFHFEGQRLLPDSTLENEGIENGDTIDVMMEQIGGGI